MKKRLIIWIFKIAIFIGELGARYKTVFLFNQYILAPVFHFIFGILNGIKQGMLTFFRELKESIRLISFYPGSYEDYQEYVKIAHRQLRWEIKEMERQ